MTLPDHSLTHGNSVPYRNTRTLFYFYSTKAEAEFYEIDFPLANPETHNIGTKSQQRAHGTEVQNERSVERGFLFVFTATNKKNRP